MTLGALVLAAGKSTRIAEVAHGLPKPLIEIGGRPIIVHALRWLSAQGVSDVWVNLHYRPEAIREALGDGAACGVRISYSLEERILGTAGAWKKLAHEWTSTSLVLYGDNLVRLDLAQMLAFHRTSGRAATIAVFNTERTPNTGIAGGRVLCDDSGRVTEFVEGGTRGFVNAGAYLLEPSVLAYIAPDALVDFGKDVLPRLAGDGQVAGYVMTDTDYCLGMDTPLSFAEAQRLLAQNEVTLP